MSFVDVIVRKRDGHALSRDEVFAFVRGVTDGSVPPHQASALLMAVVLRGMTIEETCWLTEAMVQSGERVDLSDVPGATVGKHSTGGVGDKVSIVLAPVVAACGAVVPKMSGRALGYTGGTLDKLEAIPGLRVELSIPEFKAVLAAVGTSIIGQTATLAPADRALYALRDVTGTVESVPLIAASIMSKKIAEGSRAVVLDVKCGDGAFMKDMSAARQLAETMVAVGRQAGLRTEAVVTDMDAPLGSAVGNALEVAECIETLTGGGPRDLRAIVVDLAARMLVLAGMETSTTAAADRASDALDSGRGAERFARMVERQGGDPRVVDDARRLPSVPGRAVYAAPRGGHVVRVRAGAVARAAHALGAGRIEPGAPIDPAVGVTVAVGRAAPVRRGDPLLVLHHRDGRGLDEALAWCAQAVEIGEQAAAVANHQPVLDEVRG